MTRFETSQELALTDGALHVCQDGPRDAPALLLVHGTGVSARSWEPMVPLLAESHYVIRIDLLGCGRSARPDGASYAVADQARRVAEALDRLGVDHAVVVGHSSGGTVATSLAEQRPDLVTSVVLINTGPDMAACTAKEPEIQATSFAELSDEQIRRAIADAFRPHFDVPQSFVEQVREVHLPTFAAISREITAYLQQQGLPQRLAPLGKRLLVLFGTEDLRWRPDSASDYDVVPSATVTMLPGVGHTPIVEDPPRTAAEVLAFTAAPT